jgi:hypothetical protein
MKRDNDSSFHLIFRRIAEMPASVNPCENTRLLIIDEPASNAMAKLVRYFQIQPDGRTVLLPCSPVATNAALRTWLRYLGTLLEAGGLLPDADKQVWPLPPNTCRDMACRILTGEVWPTRPLLLHVLWSIGLSPFTCTAAAIIHHHAETPSTVNADTRKRTGGQGETSDHFHAIIQGTAQ